jgi:hypothetical protein
VLAAIPGAFSILKTLKSDTLSSVSSAGFFNVISQSRTYASSLIPTLLDDSSLFLGRIFCPEQLKYREMALLTWRSPFHVTPVHAVGRSIKVSL